MESYLFRIYRIEKDNPRTLVGLVEKIGDKKRMGFISLDELWEILNSSAAMDSQPQSSLKKHGNRVLPGKAKKILERKRGNSLGKKVCRGTSQ